MINKEIEEMAKIMQKCYEKNGLLNFKWFAESAYKCLTKDSVVLKIKELEDTCNKCHWVTDYKILKRHEEEVIKLCEQEVAQARKETAKDILILLGKGFDETKMTEFANLPWYKSFCKELKHRYGVEVE